jgi:hypothetical protein
MANKKHPAPVPHYQAPRVYQRPEDLFRAEKDRSHSAARSQHAKLLAEAKAAFDKLMAEGQAARKSGRPRKHPLPPLKTGSAVGRFPTASFIRPSDVALGLVQLPVHPPEPVKAKPKAKPAAKAKPKAKAKSKAKKRK